MKFPYICYSVNPSVMIPDGVGFAPEVPVTVTPLTQEGDAVSAVLGQVGNRAHKKSAEELPGTLMVLSHL